MKILVANLGSTSFKYRLFDMDNETQLARGGVERIGSPNGVCFVEIGDTRSELETEVADHGVAVEQCLNQLTDPEKGCLANPEEVAAIGFKAVHGGRVSGVQRVNEDVLEAMAEMNLIAPAHNPPYIAAMRQLSSRFPDMPLVAAFETGFHETIDPTLRTYAAPYSWAEDLSIRRWGFHGASHRYIAGRVQEVSDSKPRRVISCHLGGSNSLCAIRDGKSIATSMGMSPQTGLPHNNRVGDFDPFALPLVMERLGKTLEETLTELSSQGGLLGVSGISGDVRDLEQAAGEGNERAQLALGLFVKEIRRHMGGMMLELGGIDALVFTAGIGENATNIRAEVCENLDEFGIELDQQLNQSGEGEYQIQSASSRAEIWVIPTNEEIVVARQTKQSLGW
jgi:acetate kinase